MDAKDQLYWDKRKEIAVAEIDAERKELEKTEAEDKKSAIDRSSERMNNVCENISNLASAMNSLDGIDATISDYDAQDISDMKRQVMAGMKYYLNKLP